jgi:hypothetical protein
LRRNRAYIGREVAQRRYQLNDAVVKLVGEHDDNTAGERAAACGSGRALRRLAVAGDGASAPWPLWAAAPGGGGLAGERAGGRRPVARGWPGAWTKVEDSRRPDGRGRQGAVAGARAGTGRLPLGRAAIGLYWADSRPGLQPRQPRVEIRHCLS